MMQPEILYFVLPLSIIFDWYSGIYTRRIHMNGQ